MFSALHGCNMQWPVPVCMLLNECLPLSLSACPVLPDDSDTEGACFSYLCVSCCKIKCANTLTWFILAAGFGSGCSCMVSLIHHLLLGCCFEICYHNNNIFFIIIYFFLHLFFGSFCYPHVWSLWILFQSTVSASCVKSKEGKQIMFPYSMHITTAVTIQCSSIHEVFKSNASQSVTQAANGRSFKMNMIECNTSFHSHHSASYWP